ncbi:MAG TPA: SMR family transporter [Devosia sp.]|nr:SMR family transporter [Devosia sp.]
MGNVYLGIAILAEIVATSCLRAAAGFTQLWPSVAVIFGYGVTFYFFSLALQTIPVGIAYAVWSGVGIVGISLVAFLVYRQGLDFPAILGMALILAGVLVINLFSRSAIH